MKLFIIKVATNFFPPHSLPLLSLFLQSLIKKTPEDHADFLLLRNALVLIKKVADQVNLGTVDDSESLAILLRIQDALGINAPKVCLPPPLLTSPSISLYLSPSLLSLLPYLK